MANESRQQAAGPVTAISDHTADRIWIRGADLVRDLIGKLTFTEMIYFHLTGQRPSRGQTAVLDAVLVTLMEHGLTPSAIATRLIYDSAPEALQAAVAAGLLGVGSTFVGTMEGCSATLDELVQAPEGVAARAATIAQRHRTERRPMHGFGHPYHKPDDPRTPALLALAADHGLAGRYVDALKVLSVEVDKAWGRHLTVNATGAVAALLLEIGIPREIMRGIAVISRSAGLVGHMLEESRTPTARFIWSTVEGSIPYSGSRS